MSTRDIILLFIAILIVAFRVYWLATRFWGQPLAQGAGPLLVKRYRAILLAEHLIEWTALAVLIALHEWRFLTLWMWGGAVLYVATLARLMAWMSNRLAKDLPKSSTAAIPLIVRRLGDYLSWRNEILLLSLLACSWGVLLTRGSATNWRFPAVMTYALLGVFLVKIIRVRSGLRLPAERTEEYYRSMEARRRLGLRVLDVMSWSLVTTIVGRAFLDGWPALQAIRWVRILIGAMFLGLYVFLMVYIVRGVKRVEATDRSLGLDPLWAVRNCGRLTQRDRWSWFWLSAYFVGLGLLVVFFRR